VTGNRTVLGLRWALSNRDGITDLPLPGMLALRVLRPADGPGPSQMNTCSRFSAPRVWMNSVW
jgi:hypothetical protein